jgi:hypothetical protein
MLDAIIIYITQKEKKEKEPEESALSHKNYYVRT